MKANFHLSVVHQNTNLIFEIALGGYLQGGFLKIHIFIFSLSSSIARVWFTRMQLSSFLPFVTHCSTSWCVPVSWVSGVLWNHWQGSESICVIVRLPKIAREPIKKKKTNKQNVALLEVKDVTLRVKITCLLDADDVLLCWRSCVRQTIPAT